MYHVVYLLVCLVVYYMVYPIMYHIVYLLVCLITYCLVVVPTNLPCGISPHVLYYISFRVSRSISSGDSCGISTGVS